MEDYLEWANAYEALMAGRLKLRYSSNLIDKSECIQPEMGWIHSLFVAQRPAIKKRQLSDLLIQLVGSGPLPVLPGLFL